MELNIFIYKIYFATHTPNNRITFSEKLFSNLLTNEIFQNFWFILIIYSLQTVGLGMFFMFIHTHNLIESPQNITNKERESYATKNILFSWLEQNVKHKSWNLYVIYHWLSSCALVNFWYNPLLSTCIYIVGETLKKWSTEIERKNT